MYEPIKSLGQNFLTDYSVGEKMIAAMEIKHTDTIVEIGPGLGILTEEIATKLDRSLGKLYAVEIDERLWSKVNSMFLSQGNVIVIHGDILEWFKSFSPDYNYKIIGSLPFYITSPILHSIIKLDIRPDVTVLMVQEEVAQKIISPKPDSSYLSVITQTFFDVEYLGKVPKKLFTPQPNVDGGIIRLIKRDLDMNSQILAKYEGFLHKGFQTPRKMLNKPFTKEQLRAAGVDPALRPQNLGAEDWLKFFNTLSNSGIL